MDSSSGRRENRWLMGIWPRSVLGNKSGSSGNESLHLPESEMDYRAESNSGQGRKKNRFLPIFMGAKLASKVADSDVTGDRR